MDLRNDTFRAKAKPKRLPGRPVKKLPALKARSFGRGVDTNIKVASSSAYEDLTDDNFEIPKRRPRDTRKLRRSYCPNCARAIGVILVSTRDDFTYHACAMCPATWKVER